MQNQTESFTNPVLDRWTIVKELGEGSTASVFLAVDQMNGEQTALKIYSSDQENSYDYFKREIAVFKDVKSHPHVLSLIKVYEEVDLHDYESNTVLRVRAIAMEYAENGDFLSYLEKQGRLHPSVARKYFSQILDSISHLHAQGLAHRDVKPENLLLDRNWNVKLADFGCSSKLSVYESAEGTQMYFAPEILAGLPHSGEQADLFSASIILFMMMVGHMPFNRAHSEDRLYGLLLKKKAAAFWSLHSDLKRKKTKNSGFDDQFVDLLNKMLAPKPEQRLSITEIWKHSWMTEGSRTKPDNNKLSLPRESIKLPRIIRR